MRVLLVESDSALAIKLRERLKRHGFDVDVRSDATKALRLALSEDYGAILLAINVPGKSGFTMLRELRRRGRAVPVMIVSSRSSVMDRVKGLNLGADDYLPKPFDIRELMARLRAIMRRPVVGPRLVLAAADLTLDPARHQVKRRGREIRLTGKEFGILEYLLQNKNAVVSGARILEHVWDLDKTPRSNLVEVYINYLRRKIDQGSAPKLIHTARGSGYVLRDDS